jgi:hypothetical protein
MSNGMAYGVIYAAGEPIRGLTLSLSTARINLQLALSTRALVDSPSRGIAAGEKQWPDAIGVAVATLANGSVPASACVLGYFGPDGIITEAPAKESDR